MLDTEREKLLDLIKGETEALRPLDEAEATHSFGRILSVTRSTPRRPRQEASALVVSNRVEVHARLSRQFSNREAVHILQGTPWTPVQGQERPWERELDLLIGQHDDDVLWAISLPLDDLTATGAQDPTRMVR